MTHHAEPMAGPPAGRRRQPGGEHLVMFPEHDQPADAQRPVPRAELGRAASAALWALRIFAIVVTAMVIYAFFSQLGG